MTFTYRGVTCRETLHGLDVTPANIQHANRVKARIDDEIARGVFEYADHFPDSKRAAIWGRAPSGVTVAELAAEWLEDVRARYEASTAETYRKGAAWALDRFGAVPVAEVDGHMVAAAVRDLGRQGLTLKTVRNKLTALRGILALAMQRGIIGTNPAAHIRPSDIIPRKQAKPSGYAVDPFTAAEVDAIIDAARAESPLWGNYWAFAFFTGLRTGEQYALQWQDVDWRGRTIRVRQAFDRDAESKTKGTKTQAGERDVILLPRALAALKAQRSETEAAGHGFVWVPATRRPFTHYASSDGPWRRFLRRARVRYRNQYQTRHTFASALISQGENPWFVARQLGHKTVEEVIRIYGRWIEQAGRQGHEFKGRYGQELTG